VTTGGRGGSNLVSRPAEEIARGRISLSFNRDVVFGVVRIPPERPRPRLGEGVGVWPVDVRGRSR